MKFIDIKNSQLNEKCFRIKRSSLCFLREWKFSFFNDLFENSFDSPCTQFAINFIFQLMGFMVSVQKGFYQIKKMANDKNNPGIFDSNRQ
jgi:hypothetical protein